MDDLGLKILKIRLHHPIVLESEEVLKKITKKQNEIKDEGMQEQNDRAFNSQNWNHLSNKGNHNEL